MPKVIIVIFFMIMPIIWLSIIGGCVECEKSGGQYVKNVYGTFTCGKGK